MCGGSAQTTNSTLDGLTRGQKVMDTGDSIKVPVGEETLGRTMNIIGESIDELGPIGSKKTYSIHRPH